MHSYALKNTAQIIFINAYTPYILYSPLRLPFLLIDQTARPGFRFMHHLILSASSFCHFIKKY